MTGRWTFDGSFMNVLKYIVVYLLFMGVLMGGIAMGLSTVTSNLYGEYIIQTVGYCLFGVSTTSFIPLLLIKCEAVYPEAAPSQSPLRVEMEKVNDQGSGDRYQS